MKLLIFNYNNIIIIYNNNNNNIFIYLFIKEIINYFLKQYLTILLLYITILYIYI